MDIMKPSAVIGTNSWGSKAYEKLLRGNSVDCKTISSAVRTAIDKDLLIFDTAQDYGLGKGQKMIGKLCPEDIIISAKFTPGRTYKKGQVRESLERDLKDFGRKYIDIYWLHLPNSIEQNLKEMAELYKEGKIHNIGVSNFSLKECRFAKSVLAGYGIKLYGVQNHYSLLARDWEKNGLVKWCSENGISFWAWAVLEEGILVPPAKNESMGLLRLIFRRRRRKLKPLYKTMNNIGRKYNVTAPQIAIAYCSSKGIVPICGCRKPYQVEQLGEAVKIKLAGKEIRRLETAVNSVNVKVLGADMFRFAVKK